MGKKLDQSRGVAKGLENLSYVGAIGVLASTLNVLPVISDKVQAVSEAVMSVLPDPVTVTSNVPGLSSLLSNSVVAQNLGLMIDLGGVALAARFVAFVLKHAGAQRGKLEKVLSGTVKLGAGGVLAAGGMNHLLFDGETFDALKWLIPFFIENGGDIPPWLASGEERIGRSAMASITAGTALGVWGLMQDFGGYQKWKNKRAEKQSTKAMVS